jgi:hypothetical protein
VKHTARREPLEIHKMKPSMTQAHSQAHTKRVCRFHLGWIPKCRKKSALATCAGRRSDNRFERFTSQVARFAGGLCLPQTSCTPIPWQPVGEVGRIVHLISPPPPRPQVSFMPSTCEHDHPARPLAANSDHVATSDPHALSNSPISLANAPMPGNGRPITRYQ